MGLDQYLYGIKKCDENTEIKYEIMYWRKSNWLQQWMKSKTINGEIEDCAYYELNIYDLKELLKLIKDVLKNKASADEKLPTTSGFFFGSTDYDEWYFEDLKKTKEFLEKTILKNEYDYYLYFAWW